MFNSHLKIKLIFLFCLVSVLYSQDRDLTRRIWIDSLYYNYRANNTDDWQNMSDLFGDLSKTGLDSIGVYNFLRYGLNKITPNMFGAAGDGATNDLSKLQSMFDDISDFSDIYFPNESVYLIDSTLTISDKDSIVIEGAHFIMGAESGSALAMVFMDSCHNVIFRNCLFDADRNALCTRWMWIQNSDNIKFEHCKFKNLGDGSASVYGVTYRQSHNTSFYQCEFKNATGVSVARFIMQTDNSSTLKPSQNASIFKCQFENILPATDGDAIYMEATGSETDIDANISYNHFVDCAKRYVKLRATNITVDHNVGIDSTLSANMYSYVSAFLGKVKITYNRFYTVSGNGCYQAVEVGATDVDSINNVLLQGNDFEADTTMSTSIGIHIQARASNININYNTITNFGYGIRGSFDNQQPIYRINISDNIFSGQTQHCIYFYSGTYNLRVINNIQPTTVTGYFFVVLDADSTHQKTFIEGNTHNSSYGILNIDKTYVQVLRDNYNGNTVEEGISGQSRRIYDRSAPEISYNHADSLYFVELTSSDSVTYSLNFIPTQIGISTVYIDSFSVFVNGDASSLIDSIRIFSTNVGSEESRWTYTTPIECNGSNQEIDYDVGTYYRDITGYPLYMRIFYNVNTIVKTFNFRFVCIY